MEKRNLIKGTLDDGIVKELRINPQYQDGGEIIGYYDLYINGEPAGHLCFNENKDEFEYNGELSADEISQVVEFLKEEIN